MLCFNLTMTSPDTSPENPHVLSFSNEPLEVKAELTLNHPEMENLTPEDRTLLEKLLRAEVYTFALALHVRKGIDPINWRNHIISTLDDIHESIFNLEGELPQGFIANILGLDIALPPYEDKLRKMPAVA